VDYAWEFGDGSRASGSTVSHTYSSDGTYTVRLTVTDDEGLTGTTTRQVTVVPEDPPNQEPVARTVLFARVRADGRLLDSSGEARRVFGESGKYSVEFDRDVSGCAVVAVGMETFDPRGYVQYLYPIPTLPMRPTKPTEPGSRSITIASGPDHRQPGDTVIVYLFDAHGEVAPGSFDLQVACEPPPRSPRTVLSAMVTPDGRVVESPDGVKATHITTGVYRLTFDEDVSKYAMVATSTTGPERPQGVSIGLPDSSLPTRLTGSTIVFVSDTKGNPQDGSFHLSAVGGSAALPRTILFAKIGADGSVTRSPDKVWAYRTGVGVYLVELDRDVSNYAMVATSTSGYEGPQHITTVAGPRSGEKSHIVMVYVFDAKGNRQDGPFDLVLIGPANSQR